MNILGTKLIGTALAITCIHAIAVPRDSGWGGVYEPVQGGTGKSTLWARPSQSITATVVGIESERAGARKEDWASVTESTKRALRATVSQIAAAVGVSRQAVHSWLNGTREPSEKHARRINELTIAATELNDALGSNLERYLSYPIGVDGETFWDILPNEPSPLDSARQLIKLAKQAETRRRSLVGILEDAPVLDHAQHRVS